MLRLYRSRLRVLKSGRTVGGGAFSQGHIHQLLANPVYAGRIRLKGVAHEGLHDAIVEPAVFDETQARLASQAARARGGGNAAQPSPFAGRLFDETGDRLTPSHANKRGVRHRYYVSHRQAAHLAEISAAVDPGAHAVLMLDQAGWHMSAKLAVPANITPLPLPPRSPELNPVEKIWQFMRDNWLSNRVFKSYDDIVALCCDAWNNLTEQPWKIMSIGMRQWAHG